MSFAYEESFNPFVIQKMKCDSCGITCQSVLLISPGYKNFSVCDKCYAEYMKEFNDFMANRHEHECNGSYGACEALREFDAQQRFKYTERKASIQHEM